MKKILILNGAPKRNGNTKNLIDKFIEGAESSGNQVKEIYLESLDIKGCMDCQYCRRQEKGISHPCVHSDDMNMIYDEFIEAELIVLASPIYWWTITGTLKKVVDRLYALYTNAGNDAYPKEGILLITAGGNDFSQPLAWYKGFEDWMSWTTIATILGNDKEEESYKIGKNIK